MVVGREAYKIVLLEENKKEVYMATSSIFANFDIKSKKEAEDFVKAIDKSLDYNANKNLTKYDELKDSDAIKALWIKRK